MRSEVLKTGRLRFARTVALVALSALGAGCSADATRFDSFYTGAVPQPQQSIPQAGLGGASQAYPGSLDQTSTGSVAQNNRQPLYDGSSGSLPPPSSQDYAQASPRSHVREGSIQRGTLAPPSAPVAVAASADEPRPYAPPARAVAEPAPVRAAQVSPAGKSGWNASGNSVTLRDGETLETLSGRYGVPVKAIMSANGLKSADQAVAGQQIAIPTYSYGEKSPARTVAATGETRQLGTPPQTLKTPSATRAASATPGHVVIESGDSLAGIARRSGVTVAELKAANGMTSDTVRIGQKLTLPGGAVEPKRVASLDPKDGLATKTVVKPAAKTIAETAAKQPKPYQAPHAQKAATEKAPEPASATTKPATQPKAVASAAQPVAPAKEEAAAPAKQEAPATTIADEEEKESASAPSSTGIDQFRWPVQGRVLKRFGEKDGARRNDGLDISVPRGTPVKAAENGVVIYAGDGLKEFGNTVLVRHDNGLVTVYGHADGLKVKRGETVKRGQEIATAGMSGDANSPMLHFEVRKNSAPVDPGKYLQ